LSKIKMRSGNMNGRLLLSIVLAFSLVLAGCGVVPGSSGNADHAFIVSGDAFRLAERSLLGEGVVVNVAEPLSFDAAVGLAAFTTSEAGVFVHAMVRDGVEVAVVVMAFDDEGGWVFTDFVSGARAVGDVDALERLAASEELDARAAPSDAEVAYSLLGVFGGGDVLDDGVQVLCAACRAEQTTVNSKRFWAGVAAAAYAGSIAFLSSCGTVIVPACVGAIAAYASAKANLARELIGVGEAQRVLDDCRRRNRC
jgi:hypothetical protein